MAESWEAILEEAIQACGGNQAELARLLNRSPSVVGNWRMGRFKPDYESCLALAEITRRSPDELLRAAGHNPRWLRVVRSLEPAPGTSSDDDAELTARKFAGALRGVPRKFWVSVVDASVALANAYGDLPAPDRTSELTPRPESPRTVRTTPHTGLRKPKRSPNRGKPGDDEELAKSEPVYLLVGAAC